MNLNIMCWFWHNWIYDKGNPSISLFRTCCLCGKKQAKSSKGEWVNV